MKAYMRGKWVTEIYTTGMDSEAQKDLRKTEWPYSIMTAKKLLSVQNELFICLSPYFNKPAFKELITLQYIFWYL